MANSLVDEIERLGALVEKGKLSRSEAVHRLVQFSDGGLTHRGAQGLLLDWRGARGAYAQVRDRTRRDFNAAMEAWFNQSPDGEDQ